ncbi:MAG: hypothetical protein EP344_03920 [Bacteroidetes bacterium]|nr:MAG: hypothetical protein EP344_03920 [Bacteroidota bacterium]
MTHTEVIQKVQLVDGVFTPSEAADMLTTLIDQEINFHKIQRLSWCEGDENCSTTYPDGRIADLQQGKDEARGLINQARREGGKLRINGTLEITISE